MLRWKKKIRKLSYLLTDVITLFLAFILGEIIFENYQKKTLILSQFERLSLVMLFTIVIILLYLVFDIYDHTIENFGKTSNLSVIYIAISIIVTEVFIGTLLYFVKVPVSRLFLFDYTLFIILITIVNRIVLKNFNYKSKYSINNRNRILVVGGSDRGSKYIEEIRKHEYLNYNIMGYVSIKDPNAYNDIETLGELGDLIRIVTDYVIDEIAVARSLYYDERLPGILAECQDMGITVTMLLETQNNNTKAQVAMVGSLPVLKFHTVSLNEDQKFIKRIIDVIGSCFGIILFAIAYVVLGPLIKLETSGPVIFKQDRVGMNGRIFKVLKFRSMGVDAELKKAALMSNNEMNGHMFKMSNDPRVTRIGSFIRKTSIDELPQFINVMKGDMSLVGTRPPTLNEVRVYENRHRRRICIKPGITGKWQVSGRSEIEDFEEVVKLDSEYIKDWSVELDIRILLKTILVVFQRKGSK